MRAISFYLKQLFEDEEELVFKMEKTKVHLVMKCVCFGKFIGNENSRKVNVERTITFTVSQLTREFKCGRIHKWKKTRFS